MNEYLAELIGTMILIILGGGVNAGVSLSRTYAHQAGWLVVAVGWGLAVALGIYAVGRISGAHINPAVTLGLAAAGAFPWEKVVGYITGQMTGAFIGAVLVWIHYLPHWSGTADPGTKLGVFSTGPALSSRWANLVSEIIGTFVLLFALQFIGANQFAEDFNPFAIGLLIIAIGLSLGGTTGYAINPARDLGPRLAHFTLPIAGKGASNWSYAWIPVVGPMLGGIQGALSYLALFEGKMSFLFVFLTVVNVCIIGLAIRETLAAQSETL
ncbi:MAG: aquaporin family protein [Bacteroidia bacterium]|nr:aquaporin family protein [Bacteroidia bacterium]